MTNDTRSQLVGKAAGLAGVAALVALARQAVRHRRVLRGVGDEVVHTCASGNRLSYRLSEPQAARTGRPVVVFETALLSTSQHWGWLRQELVDDFPVLSYDRAGYGRSEYRQADAYSLGSSIADCLDLLQVTVPGRQLILVGHSQGGYLALRTAAELGPTVVGLVLIDPTHPAQLQRSQLQRQGAAEADQSLQLMPATLRLGGGGLLTAPNWVRDLPEQDQPLARAQYADWKLWAAGSREWRAVYAHLLDPPQILPPIAAPIRIVAAARTCDNDPKQQGLFQEIVDASPNGDLAVIKGFSHEELVFHRTPASVIAELIRTFNTSQVPTE
ncbi:alpha/beta hydrolase [Streptomyces sp. NPDC050095]|uniref:alpha/beta hydrolase n=1 Tax=unclassified Streptomyces TaxID=2593676 RepID=UPI0034135DF1